MSHGRTMSITSPQPKLSVGTSTRSIGAVAPVANLTVPTGAVQRRGGLHDQRDRLSGIVARDLGIPAIVGTRTATTAITTGDNTNVDGDAGTVTYTSQPAR
jgi:phosphohistidine swiveling domain-containing protein